MAIDIANAIYLSILVSSHVRRSVGEPVVQIHHVRCVLALGNVDPRPADVECRAIELLQQDILSWFQRAIGDICVGWNDVGLGLVSRNYNQVENDQSTRGKHQDDQCDVGDPAQAVERISALPRTPVLWHLFPHFVLSLI